MAQIDWLVTNIVIITINYNTDNTKSKSVYFLTPDNFCEIYLFKEFR